MPLSKILESCVAISVLEAVDVHLSEEKCFMVIAYFFYVNRAITLGHGTNTHSYVIGFCSRLMGLKAS